MINSAKKEIIATLIEAGKPELAQVVSASRVATAVKVDMRKFQRQLVQLEQIADDAAREIEERDGETKPFWFWRTISAVLSELITSVGTGKEFKWS